MTNYPYRACRRCGEQIHVGGVYLCDRCAGAATPHVSPVDNDAETRDRETEGLLSQQLINGADREGVDAYTKTLLWHASGLINRQSVALDSRDAALREALQELANLTHDIERALDDISGEAGEVDRLEAALREAREEIDRLRDLFRLDGEQHAAFIKNLTEAHEARITKYAETVREAREERDRLRRELSELEAVNTLLARSQPATHSPVPAKEDETWARWLKGYLSEREQQVMKRALEKSTRLVAFGSSVRADDHEVGQPSPEDVERAREIISEWLEHDLTSWLDTELAELRELIAAALCAARSPATVAPDSTTPAVTDETKRGARRFATAYLNSIEGHLNPEEHATTFFTAAMAAARQEGHLRGERAGIELAIMRLRELSAPMLFRDAIRALLPPATPDKES